MSCKNLVCFFDRFVIVCKFCLSLFLFRKCFNILKAVKKVNNIFFSFTMNWYTVPKLVFEFSVKKILLKKGVQLWLVWIKKKCHKLSRDFLAWLWIRCIKPLSFDVSKTLNKWNEIRKRKIFNFLCCFRFGGTYSLYFWEF